MKKIFVITVTGVLFLLGIIGGANAQGVTPQTLLPGALIPKFVDRLPVAGDVSVVIPPAGGGYNITMYEFQSQILPSTGVPGAVPPIPANTASWVWGYLTDADVAAQAVVPAPIRPSYLGPVVLAQRNSATNPTYINALPYGVLSNVQHLLPVDQTLDWADPLGNACAGLPPTGTCAGIYSGPQPAVPHIHGGEVEPAFDGGPDAWWLPVNTIAPLAQGIGAPAGATAAGRATFTYPNTQQAGTIWFHDHALGATRLNVFAGMAGLHPIFDPANELPKVNEEGCTGGAICLPAFPAYDIPLIIQDRSFDTAGQIFYNLASNPQPNPTVHPYWIPEFIGDSILVNGKTWPFLDVEPRQYRFRFVNGSNARFYDLTLTGGLPFIVIATDVGYLDTAVPTTNLIIGPGERYEVIVDFSAFTANAATPPTIVMNNSARTPFPGGAKVVKGTTDTVMQFRVKTPLNAAIPNTAIAAGTNLRPLNPINPAHNITAVVPSVKRQLTLNEVVGPGGPLELVLNNTKYNKVVTTSGFTTRETEKPQIGATELWEIINITADAHPMHIHFASFQLVNRQAFRASAWTRVYNNALAATYGPVFDGMGPPNQYTTRNADGAIGGNPAIGSYLQANKVRLPLPYENGWKDTVITYPGEVTRIMVRFTPTDIAVGSETPGFNQYVGLDPLNVVNGVGYVWHCHIVDHEDNEMMRPYTLQTVSQ
ncbi:MAG: multicopper oxidase domain-containing protein [Syntrophorhabdaceae bacterium]